MISMHVIEWTYDNCRIEAVKINEWQLEVYADNVEYQLKSLKMATVMQYN